MIVNQHLLIRCKFQTASQFIHLYPTCVIVESAKKYNKEETHFYLRKLLYDEDFYIKLLMY